jgi:branched-chain amino acid transport system permease protein
MWGLSLVLRRDAGGQRRAWRVLHAGRGDGVVRGHLVGGHPALGFVAALLVAPLLVGGLAAAADMTILKRIDYDPERTIVATIGMLYIIQQGCADDLRARGAAGGAALQHPHRAALARMGRGGWQMVLPLGLSARRPTSCA